MVNSDTRSSRTDCPTLVRTEDATATRSGQHNAHARVTGARKRTDKLCNAQLTVVPAVLHFQVLVRRLWRPEVPCRVTHPHKHALARSFGKNAPLYSSHACEPWTPAPSPLPGRSTRQLPPQVEHPTDSRARARPWPGDEWTLRRGRCSGHEHARHPQCTMPQCGALVRRCATESSTDVVAGGTERSERQAGRGEGFHSPTATHVAVRQQRVEKLLVTVAQVVQLMP